MNCPELAKPGLTVSCCTYVRTQTIQFYPGLIRELCSTRFNPVHSVDTLLVWQLVQLDLRNLETRVLGMLGHYSNGP